MRTGDKGSIIKGAGARKRQMERKRGRIARRVEKDGEGLKVGGGVVRNKVHLMQGLERLCVFLNVVLCLRCSVADKRPLPLVFSGVKGS
jgi:hypothetical protein